MRSDHIRALRALHQKKKRSVPLKRPCAAYYEIVSQALALPCAVSTGDVQGISETTKASPERSDS